MKKSSWMAGAVMLALVAGGGAWWWNSRSTGGEATYRTGKLERGALMATVSASGNVNPVSQVSVSSQISGQIKELFADFNSEVKAGQLIAQIDPATYEYRVRSAEADLDAAQANVLTAQANATVARASVSRAQTDLAEARRIHERNLRLIDQGFIAQSEADRTRAAVATAEEALKGAQAQVGVTEAQIKTAQATVAQRTALVAQAKVDLGRTRIVSPVGGIVIKRAVEQGQTVAASLAAPEMFVIAQNLSDMQVDASIDEADVGRIRSGQKASFTVDAFPGQTFEGEVRQVRKAAQNVANVVTYIAVVGFQNGSGRLLPGMTANVRIVTDQRDNVLKVPNAALRVRVPGVEPEKVATQADQASAGGQKGTESAAPAPAAPAAPAGGSNPATEFRNKLVAPRKRKRSTPSTLRLGRASWLCATCPKPNAPRPANASPPTSAPASAMCSRPSKKPNTPPWWPRAQADRPRADASTCWGSTTSPKPTTCGWASATARPPNCWCALAAPRPKR